VCLATVGFLTPRIVAARCGESL